MTIVICAITLFDEPIGGGIRNTIAQVTVTFNRYLRQRSSFTLEKEDFFD